MDTYRGSFIDRGEDGEDFAAYDHAEDEAVNEPPPSPVGQDERRMQVRAYNHWASLLDGRNFPSIEDLDPDALPDFGPYSVLLDFTGGIENPSVQFLGDKLAEECGANGVIETLSDVPARSLLSRITDHYMQILANQAPIGFEAEFVNLREKTILYRGILLPFSSDDDTIDFIYGVINWKELADQATTDELLQEIDNALDVQSEPRRADPLTDWADGPPAVLDLEAEAGTGELDLAADHGEDHGEDSDGHVLDLEVEAGDYDELEPANYMGSDQHDDEVLELDSELADPGEDEDVLDLTDLTEPADEGYELPEPAFGSEEPAGREPLDLASLTFPEEPETAAEPAEPAEIAPAAELSDDMGLADWLASARELADAARGSEDRTRQALYAAIGKAYDFSLAAAEQPEEFAELVVDSGLSVQDRAPMTPVVKLVFGAEYDKTRLTEYASALSHAHRIGLGRGELADYLGKAHGGLKGVVTEERRIKREESGKPAEMRDTPREALARKLRKLEHFPLDAVPADGSEFTLLVARRLPTGEVVLLGEVADDIPLLERAARKILS